MAGVGGLEDFCLKTQLAAIAGGVLLLAANGAFSGRVRCCCRRCLVCPGARHGSPSVLVVEDRWKDDNCAACRRCSSGGTAVAGGGLAWLPHWLGASHVVSGELALVMGSDRVLSVDIHALWSRNRYLPLRVRTLIDALAEQVPRLLG